MTAHILVVDDDATNLSLIAKILSFEGYEVTITKGGDEALNIANQINPDLIILDVMMPVIDGYELCRRLRKPPINATMPIIMLTAVGDAQDRSLALEAGANDLITKPLDMEVLQQLIIFWLNRDKGPQTIQ